MTIGISRCAPATPRDCLDAMSTRISQQIGNEDLRLLCDVATRRAPELLPKLGQTLLLSVIDRQELCEVLAIELMSNGLDSNDNPTSYGLAVESVLDIVNRPNLFPEKYNWP